MAGDAPGTTREMDARPGVPSPTARLALYRRYRPATFAEVKGQEHVTEPLRQALRNGRVHHAYLFSGPRGCGKTSSARILARSLNCAQGPTPDPCGVCESCIALAPSGPGSIDVMEIDAASHGGVDDARDLRERAFYAPVSGRFKVYIIDEAHMVTREGFNALLKLVEEPPPHLKFVFATTEPEKVIATIRSRTHHYPFRLVPPGVLRDLLEGILATEGISYQPEVLPLVVRAGAGSARDSLSVLDQLLAGAGEEGLTYERTVALLGYTDDSLLDDMVDAFSAGDGAAAFGAVDRVVQGGHDPRRFAADLLDRLRDLIILAAVPGAGKTGLLDAPADRLERMADQAGRFGQAELARAAEILSEGLIQMRGTASPRLLLELMCAQVLLPGAGTGERALLARLERLERRLENAAPEPGPASGRLVGQSSGKAGSQPAGRPPRTAETAGRRPGTGGPPESAGHSPGAADVGDPQEGQGGSGGPHAATPVAEPAERAAGPAAEDEDTVPAAQRPAPGTQRPAPGTQRPAPGTQGQPRPRAGAGPADADTLRQRWPEILDAVRAERKVAWLLLRGATVHSLENRMLTLAFPREGEAKGFSASGHDQILMSVLGTLLGLSVRVRATVGAEPAPGRPGGSAPEGPAPSHPTPATTPGGRSGRQEANRADTQGSRPSAPRSPAHGPEAAAAGPEHPLSGSPARQASRADPQTASGGLAAKRLAASNPSSSPRSSAFADEEWPDDAAGPGNPAGVDGLTGMELIQRQLGGRIIGEIEEG